MERRQVQGRQEMERWQVQGRQGQEVGQEKVEVSPRSPAYPVYAIRFCCYQSRKFYV